MRPLAEFAGAVRRAVRVVLTDLDDTLTTDGMLPSSSLRWLEELAAADFIVIPVTGRPAGWCDHIARMWPVHGVVGENGALFFSYDRKNRKMHAQFAKSGDERKRDSERLSRLRDQILVAVPGAGVASDQAYRVADLAIDFREDAGPLSEDDVAKIVSIFERGGATAKVSSIHVNGWFGAYDKLTMTADCLRDKFGFDMKRDNERIVYVGDSPNDAPMFAAFANSVGVANVRRYDMSSLPTWVTRQESARGFAELATALLEAGSPRGV